VSPTLNGLISLYAAIFLLAGNGYFAKSISISVFDITAYRSLLAALALLVFMRIRKQSLSLLSTRHYLLSVGLALLLGLHWVTFFYSMRISTVAVGMTALYTYPVITVFLERLFFGRTIRLFDLMMALLVLFGIWLMGDPGSDSSAVMLEGVIWGVFSALCFAGRNVAQQRYLRHYPAQLTIFYQVLLIGLCFAPFVESSPMTLLENADNNGLKLLLLGFAFTALPHALLANSLRVIRVKSVALIGCLQPVIGAGIAFILLGEQPSLQMMVGASLVLAASVFETLKPARI